MSIKSQTVILASVLLALSGCGKGKLNIDGQRIPVLDEQSVVAADYMKGDINIVLPQAQINRSWNQSGGNSRHNAGHLYVSENLTQKWSKSFGQGNSKRDYLIASPVVADGVVFAIDASAEVSAYKYEDGTKLWSTRLKPQIREDKTVSVKGAGLAFAGEKIFATTGFGGVFAINAENGEIIWKFYDKTPIRIAPTVGGNKVFVQTIENVLIALNQQTGEEVWRYISQDEDTVLVGGAAPAYDDGLDILIAGFSNGEIRAIKASTGSPLWSDYLISGFRSNLTADINAIHANPIIGDNVVFALGNNIVTALDIRTGQRIWEREFGGTNQPWLAEKVLYMLSDNAQLLAIDSESGKIIWDTKIPATPKESSLKDVTFAGPVLVGERLLVVNSAGYAFFVSPTDGEIIANNKIGQGSTITPVVADGQIFITTTNAKLLNYR